MSNNVVNLTFSYQGNYDYHQNQKVDKLEIKGLIKNITSHINQAIPSSNEQQLTLLLSDKTNSSSDKIRERKIKSIPVTLSGLKNMKLSIIFKNCKNSNVDSLPVSFDNIPDLKGWEKYNIKIINENSKFLGIYERQETQYEGQRKQIDKFVADRKYEDAYQLILNSSVLDSSDKKNLFLELYSKSLSDPQFSNEIAIDWFRECLSEKKFDTAHSILNTLPNNDKNNSLWLEFSRNYLSGSAFYKSFNDLIRESADNDQHQKKLMEFFVKVDLEKLESLCKYIEKVWVPQLQERFGENLDNDPDATIEMLIQLTIEDAVKVKRREKRFENSDGNDGMVNLVNQLIDQIRELGTGASVIIIN